MAAGRAGFYPNVSASLLGAGSNCSELKAENPVWVKNMLGRWARMGTGTSVREELASAPRQGTGAPLWAEPSGVGGSMEWPNAGLG